MPSKSKRAKISTNICTCGLLNGGHGNNSNRGKTYARTRERSLLRCRRSTPRVQASPSGQWNITPVGRKSHVAPFRKRGRLSRARQASTVAVKRRRQQRNVKPATPAAGSSLKAVAKEEGKGKHALEESQKSEMQPLKNHPSVDTLPEPSPCSNESNAVLYALHLSRNPDNPEEVQFRCVSEFLLVSPCIAIDVSRISRSLSLDRPFVAYDSGDSDNIEALLNLIHPKELKTGKLSFFVPLGIYMQRDQHTKEEQLTPEPSLDNDPLSTVGTVGNCSSPLLPEGSKSSIPFNVFSKMFNRRPTSASSRPYSPPPNGDVPSVPPPTESSLSVDSNTPQAASEHEVTPTGQCFGGGDICDSGNDGEASFLTAGKIPDAEPANEDPIVATVFGSGSTHSLHTSATDPSQLPFRGMGGLSKASELSDSVRSLAGSSSVASLSNSMCRDPSILDFSRPVNDVFAKAMSLSMNQPLSDSVRSLDGSSNDVIATSGSLKSLQIHPSVTPAPPPTESGASGDVEVIQLLKSLLSETKAQAASIKTLTNKILENKNQLTKLANVQSTILRQVNVLTPSPTSSTTTVASTSPPWANQLVDQVRKQKAETTRQLAHLETLLNNVQNSAASKASTKKPQAASVLGAKQVQTLQEQTRDIIRNEMQKIFQSNIPTILEPLRQHLRASLEEMLSPLPKTVADRMLSVIVDPKFTQYFSGQMSTTIAPSMTIAYREELRRVLVPAFTKGIDKLTKELDELVKSALNQHMQLIITKMDSGVQSSRDKIDASTRKFDDQVNRLSKDIAAKVTTQLNELLKVASQHQPQPLAPDTAMSSALATGGAGLSASTPKDLSVKGSKSAFDTAGGGGGKQQLRNFISGGTASVDPYQSALMFIQNHQYVEALETALTSANQILLLKVLQNVPVVQLFRQNVKQELLLSLIHQLSCGQLQEQLEMKISFLQEAVNHLRMNDDTVKELGSDILSMLVTKITQLRGTGMLTSAEENRALALVRSVQEKWQNRTLP
ncbi:Enhancer of mRNA-decapping protein 4 [Taenia solium]|eukprot:TsM_001145400 transcript=TsM_001145400 gene=TsM_001145400